MSLQPDSYRDINHITEFLESKIGSKTLQSLKKVKKLDDSQIEIDLNTGHGLLTFILDFKKGLPPNNEPRISLKQRLLHPKLGFRSGVVLSDLGIKKVGYVALIRIIRTLTQLFARRVHRPNRSECSNQEEVKDVDDEDLFQLKRGDCWDINNLVKSILEKDFHNLDGTIEELRNEVKPRVRLWRDDAQLSEIITHPKVEKKLQEKVVLKGLHGQFLFLPDIPLTDEEEKRQLETLALYTMAMRPVKIRALNLDEIELKPLDEIKEIVLQYFPNIERTDVWAGWKGIGHPELTSQWSLLSMLLEKGFEDIKERGVVVTAFTDEDRLEHRKLLTHMIISNPDRYLPAISEALYYCPTGIWDAYIDLTKPLIEGGAPIEKVSQFVENAKEHLIKALTVRLVDRRLDTHWVKALIKAVNEQYGEEPEVYVTYPGDVFSYDIGDKRRAERLKLEFIRLWPQFLKEQVVEPLSIEVNSISYPDLTHIRGAADLPKEYQVWMAEKQGFINKFIKPLDKGQFIDDDDLMMMKLKLVEKNTVFLILAIIVSHEMEERIVEPEVIAKGLELIFDQESVDSQCPEDESEIDPLIEEDQAKERQAKERQVKERQAKERQARERQEQQARERQARERQERQAKESEEREAEEARELLIQELEETAIKDLMKLGLEALKVVADKESKDPGRAEYRKRVIGILKWVKGGERRNVLLRKAIARL